MWVCLICRHKRHQVRCCRINACEHSLARFDRIEDFWEHTQKKHPEAPQFKEKR